MTAALALARAELLMLGRNRTAAVTALLLPLGAGLWITTETPASTPLGSVAAIAALQLLTVIGFTVLGTATVTLVARRQARVLERWRTSSASTATVVAGTVAPPLVLLVVQAGILFTASAMATGTPPARPLVLLAATVLGGFLGASLAFATAAATRNVEAASVTTLPVLVPLVGGGIWAIQAGAGQVAWPMRATGGGAIAELVMVGWNGPAGSDGGLAAVAPPAVVLAVLAVAVALVAANTFRWRARD